MTSAKQKKKGYVSEKGGNDLYPFTSMGFGQRDIENRYNGVLAPLQLFAPYPHEDEEGQDHDEKEEFVMRKDPPPENDVLERPNTPINDEIKVAPTQLTRLTKYVRRRVTADPSVEHLSMEDQNELAAIILGEVNNVWADIRMQVDDPFFSDAENVELQRRITVHIVTVCEQLFHHYIDKAQILNRRGVFSGPANMSRLKAQLALDANQFLNILTIRRYIVDDLRRAQRGEADPAERPRETGQSSNRPLTNKGFLEASRPKSRYKREPWTSAQRTMQQLAAEMPDLDTKKLQAIVAEMPRPRSTSYYSDAMSDHTKHSLKQSVKRKTSEDFSREKVLLKRCDSAPKLGMESLFEELGIEDDGRGSRLSLAAGHSPATVEDGVDSGYSESPVAQDVAPRASVTEPRPGTREYLDADLRKLVGTREPPSDDPDEMPSLLQALTVSAKHDNKQAWIDDQLKELEEKEAKYRKEESLRVIPPTHPQPATLVSRLPGRMFARTSDVRVSERVCLSSMVLDKYNTVYNDLIDEIDPATVKKLDSNLFLGDEISEVYREIMKTVPTDHLSMEGDSLIEPAADAVYLNTAVASSTLGKTKVDRVLNPVLVPPNVREAPWGLDGDQRLWARTPAEPPTDLKGRALIQPLTPRGEDKGTRDFLGKHADKDRELTFVEAADMYIDNNDNMAKLKDMGEVMARSYNNWLGWWKNHMSYDDYLKYISTQDTDYLGAVFHFYNDEEEADDAGGAWEGSDHMTSKKAQKLSEEREKKKEELRSVKHEFKQGFWNPNTIFMGGLGQDPELEEDNFMQQLSKSKADSEASKPESKGPLGIRKKSKKADSDSDLRAKTRDASELGTSRALTSSVSRGASRGGAASRATSKATAQSKKGRGVGGGGTAEAADAGPLTYQDRLERVWEQLKMPDAAKLDMAIKYSSNPYLMELDEAIEAWEKATDLVLARERLLARLENFERLASDPNRFFERGIRGSSVARLQEARHRTGYYKRIEAIEEKLNALMHEMQKNYQDKVTFQGRPYEDKMNWDRTEMLFWLQEERKQQALDYEARVRAQHPTPAPTASIRLDPMSPQVTINAAV